MLGQHLDDTVFRFNPTQFFSIILTTNLPFSEWTQVFPNARLCKALLDRVTDRAHIIETGTESYRFKRTISSKKRGNLELVNRTGAPNGTSVFQVEPNQVAEMSQNNLPKSKTI
jgi:hypothetical protein